MKKYFFLFILFLWASKLHAERAAYETNPNLIRMGGYMLFFNSRGPLSYSTLNKSDLPSGSMDLGIVKCESCQYGLSIPIFTSAGSRSSSISGAQGDGSFKKALANLQVQRPELRGIYDVKVDLHQINILGIYKKLCTEVSARGFK